jgi:hypothetical protein
MNLGFVPVDLLLRFGLLDGSRLINPGSGDLLEVVTVAPPLLSVSVFDVEKSSTKASPNLASKNPEPKLEVASVEVGAVLDVMVLGPKPPSTLSKTEALKESTPKGPFPKLASWEKE